MSSLSININGTEYTEKFNTLNISSYQTVFNGVVYVDGSELLNQFTVSCNEDWIEVKRVRNLVTMTIKENTRITERMATVIFTHNLDANIYVRLTIIQGCAEYNITAMPLSVDEGIVTTVREDGCINIFFHTLLDRYCNIDGVDKLINEESVTIKVSAIDGFEDFGVKAVTEFVRNAGKGVLVDVDENWPGSAEDIMADNYKMANYDGGLKIHKIDKQTLEITNYGKISLFDKVFYILKIYHVNNPNNMVEIHIGYINSNENNGTGFGFDDGE